MSFEIVFFDVETTVPTRPGQGHAILEFGAILVCPRKLVELQSYSTLVRPSDLSLISSNSVRCNGITPESVSSAPTFSEIADHVYNILHGRVWAGHNILRFDCARIREAFAELGRPAPEPKGTIDSLALLTQKFGRRAGDMKMASLASYFGLGSQKHRSLEDVRMNLDVVKCCATILFLESSLPDIYPANSWIPPNATTGGIDHSHPNHSLLASANEEQATANPDHFNMSTLCVEIKSGSEQLDATMDEEDPIPQPLSSSEGSSGSAGYLQPEQVSIPLITASMVPHYRGTHRTILLHDGFAFQLFCSRLRVRLGVMQSQYHDYARRQRLSFVVDISPTLCQILDACEGLARKLSVESASSSEWNPVVYRQNDSFSPGMRLHIQTTNAYDPSSKTEIYRSGSSGAVEEIVFGLGQCNIDELRPIINTGTFVDAHFTMNPYDYCGSAGIRLVAKKLFIHSN